MKTKTKVISVLNFKGGVGKTTTVLNLGAALARTGKKVLIIDLDVQMNTSFVLGYSSSDGESMYDVLMDKVEDNNYPIYDTKTEGLVFIPSNMNLTSVEMKLEDNVDINYVLADQLAKLKRRYPFFDYILIDCPPAKGFLTNNALCASDSLLVPITCELMTMQGVMVIIEKYKQVTQRANKNLKIEGFLLTKYNKGYKVGQFVRDLLTQKDVKVFDTSIRNCMALNVYCNGWQNVFDYDAKCNGSQDYMNLAEEIIKNNK